MDALISGLNSSAITATAEFVASPLWLSVVAFLVVFALTVLYSSIILWLVLRSFNVKANSMKKALIVALISNLATSLLFGGLVNVGRLVFGAIDSSGKLLVVVVSIIGFAVIMGINLFLEKKFYKLPARTAFNVMLSWSIMAFLAANIFTKFLAPWVANLLAHSFLS